MRRYSQKHCLRGCGDWDGVKERQRWEENEGEGWGWLWGSWVTERGAWEEEGQREGEGT